MKYIFVIKSFIINSCTVTEKIRSTETLGPSSGCTRSTRTSIFFNITWVQLHFGLMLLLIHELSGGGGIHNLKSKSKGALNWRPCQSTNLNRYTLTDSFHIKWVSRVAKCLNPPPRQNVRQIF